DPTLPDGIAAERTRAILEQCAALLREVEGVRDVLALSEEPFDLYRDRACLLVRLDSAGEKPEGRDRIMQTIRDRLKEVEGMTLRLRAPSQAGHFLQLNYPLDFALHGPELNSVRELAKKLAARMSESKKLMDVAAGSESVPQLFFDIDRVRLRDLG